MGDLNRQKRRLLSKWHPDVNTDPNALNMSQQVNAAYTILKSYLGNSTVRSSGDIDIDIDVPKHTNDGIWNRREVNEVFLSRMAVDLPYLVRGGKLDYGEMNVWYASYPAINWLDEKNYQAYVQTMYDIWETYNKKKLSGQEEEAVISLALDVFERGYTIVAINDALLSLLNNPIEVADKKNWWDRVKDRFSS